MRFFARVGGREFALEIERAPAGSYHAARTGGAGRPLEARRIGQAVLLAGEGRTIEAVVTRAGDRLYSVVIGGRAYAVTLEDPLRLGAPAAGAHEGGHAEIRAVMPGKVVALLAREGEEVLKGQGVVVIEAMKMENEIAAPRDGRVTGIRVKPGETVEAGAVLLVVE